MDETHYISIRSASARSATACLAGTRSAFARAAGTRLVDARSVYAYPAGASLSCASLARTCSAAVQGRAL